MQTYSAAKEVELHSILASSVGDELKEKHGVSSKAYIDHCVLTGKQFLQLGELEKAEEVFRVEIDYRTREMPDTWFLANSQSLLGDTLRKRNKLEEAKPFLESGYYGMRKNYESMPSSGRESTTTKALISLIALAKATNNNGDLEKWEAELSSIEEEFNQ